MQQRPPRQRLSCAPGMFNSSEVKVSTDLMEVRVSKNARATVARRGLKEAWSKCASRWTKTGYKA